jgi:hypothetical protein
MVDIQVLPCPQWIFPSKIWFFGIYLDFHWQKSLNIQYLPHCKPKSYRLNSIKSCSSRSFQQHQSNIPIPPKFSASTYLIFSEEIIRYSRTSTPHVQTPRNQSDGPLLLKNFPKRPRTRSKASLFAGSHKYKQN